MLYPCDFAGYFTETQQRNITLMAREIPTKQTPKTLETPDQRNMPPSTSTATCGTAPPPFRVYLQDIAMVLGRAERRGPPDPACASKTL